MNLPQLLTQWRRPLWPQVLLVLLLVLGLTGRSQAQVYYLTSDGVAATASAADALNRLDTSNGGMTTQLSSITTSPALLAIDKAGNRAFVYEGLTANRAIKVFTNISTSPTQASYTLPVPAQVTAIEYDAASDYVYFLTTDGAATTQTANDALNRIKADGTGANQVLLASFTTSPLYLALNTAANRAYVYEGLTASRGIKVIDLSANTVIGTTIAVPALVTAIDYAPSNGYIYYLTSDNSGTTGTAAALDAVYRTLPDGTDNNPVIASVTNAPAFMTLDLANNRVYVADNFNNGTVNTRSFKVVQTTGGTNGTVTATYAQATLLTAIELGQASPTTVTSIVPASTNPTNAASVQFTVTFAASVSGLTTSNFATSPSAGITGSSVTSVVAVSGTTYTVTVNTGSGSGTLGLTLANDTGLTPGVSNEPFTGTPLYTIDKTAPVPTITSSTAANGGSTSTSPIVYTVTFSEAVNNFIQTDVTVTNGNITGFSNSGNVYTVTVTPIANGAVAVSVAAGVAQDAVGNNNVASTPNPYSITYTAPTATVTSISKLVPTAAQSTTGTATTQVQFTVTFSAAVSGVTASNFSLTQTTSGASITSVSPTTGSSANYTVTVNTGSGNGTLQLNVANATGITPSVTNTPYSGTSAVYTITKSFAAAPTLRIQAGGSNSGNGDVTAFVDLVQVLQSGTSTAVANALQNGSFETNNVDPSSFRKATDPTPVSATPWSFTGTSGVSRNGSAFGSTAAGTSGDAVALVQSAGNNNAGLSQNLAVPTGSYQVNFQAMQRNYTSLDQRLDVFVNDVFVGNIQPNNNPTYDAFTSAPFSVTAPALTATVSTTSASPTSTSPIPFTVTFSQSVGSTFIASDVSVNNGTVTSGPTAGPNNTYTFSVTPSGTGIVTVSLAAGVAQDANNTNNSASNSLSVQYNQPVTAAPVVIVPANGSPVSTTTPTYSGTAPAGSTVTVYVDGVALSGTVTANASGNWSKAQSSALSQGSHTVYATAQTSGSTVSANSNTNTFTVDTVAPAAPVVTAPANGSTVATTTPTYTGAAEANSTVTVIVDGSSIGTTTATSGSFSLVQPTALAQGSHTVRATATDAAGNVSASSSTNNFTVQLATVAPVLNQPANVANGQPTFSGTAPAGSAIVITIMQGSTTVRTISGITTAANGTFSYTSTQAQAVGIGTYTVTATAQTSGSAVSAASNQRTFVVPTAGPTTVLSSTAPDPTTVAPIPVTVTFSRVVTGFDASDVTATNSGGGITTVSTPTTGDGKVYTFDVTPSTTGLITVSVPANAAQDSLSRNNLAATNLTRQYNQPATAAPVVTAPTNNSFTNNANITISGTAPANSSITLYLSQNGGAFQPFMPFNAAANGTFSIGPLPFPEGTYQVYATAQSPNSSVSPNSPTITFTVDRTAPTVTLSSTTVAANGTTSTSPVNFTATFSEALISFNGAGIQVNNGTVVSGPTAGANNTYTFQVQPTAVGSVSVTVAAGAARDFANNTSSASATYAFTFASPTITVAPATLPGGTRGTAYSQTLTASGGTAPYSYAITAGALPAGLTLSSAGALAGTPAASGSFTFTVTATDASTSGGGPYAGSRSYTLTIAAPTLTIAPATLPGGTVAAAYSQTITASGGTAPYSYAITVGALPAGLSLTSAGVLAGAPTAGGSFTFTVTATDASTSGSGGPYTATRSYTLTIAAPTIVVSPTTLPAGTQGTAYSQTITASGGTAPYSYAITAGALPAGLTLASNGTLSGSPTASGSFTFTATATDASTGSGPYSGSRSYTLTIAPAAVTAVGWTGNVSTDWFVAGNWSPTQVPDATIDATIPSAPSGGLFPVIGANGGVQATAKSVNIASSASLSMSANTLTIAGNLTNNGAFNGFTGSGGTATGGTVVLGSSALSSITGGGTNRFWNLTAGANGVQLTGSSAASVRRLLTLNGNLASNNALTLVSDATATAMVVNSGGVVTGNTTVQRYIDPTLNPNAGYRHISPAISNATVASLTIPGSFSPTVNSLYNGSSTPLAIRPFPTVYGYDQSRLATTNNNLTIFDKGWFSPNDVTDPLPVGLGRTVLIAANQTWNFTGTLNNSDQNLNLGRNSGPTPAIANASGLHLVGNPYPSPLDWGLVGSGDRTNVDNVIYVYRSNNPANPYLGIYGSYNGGTFTGGLTSTVLAQGQGFFVRVTQGQTAGSLTFRNAQRVSTYQTPTYARTTEIRPFVRLALQGVNSTDVDDAVVYFEQGATADNDGEYDAEKLSNPSGLNVSTSVSATLRMAINGLSPLGTAQLVVPVAVGVPAVGSYTLKAAQLLNLGGTPTYLRDRQTGAVIDLARQASYQFSVSDASALLTGRFELVFSPQGPLATSQAALAQQVALYPNPATGSAFVALPAALGRTAVTATLVDAVGREVRTVSLPAQGAAAHSLDLRELPSGVYLLHLHTSAGTLVKKLTVE